VALSLRVPVPGDSRAALCRRFIGHLNATLATLSAPEDREAVIAAAEREYEAGFGVPRGTLRTWLSTVNTTKRRPRRQRSAKRPACDMVQTITELWCEGHGLSIQRADRMAHLVRGLGLLEIVLSGPEPGPRQLAVAQKFCRRLRSLAEEEQCLLDDFVHFFDVVDAPAIGSIS
jgi:hypothetical protein